MTLCYYYLTNEADPNLNEQLVMAASEGHHDILSLLLSKGADPDTVDKSGQTAIGEAMDYGHKNIVLLLQNYARSMTPVPVYPSLLPTTLQASSNPFLPPYNYNASTCPLFSFIFYSSQPLFSAPHQPLYNPRAPGYVPNQPYYSNIA
uniref:Uncharacterized protein n=1 Tax=Amphimedon queenslandica TaxID=400682 RepID=A0A1X7TMM3_AMPQE